MSKDAMLPCFVCGAELQNSFGDVDNQPSQGTEFRTYGHYGSTFWDSFNGEELIINICDPCLRSRTAGRYDGLPWMARQRRWRRVVIDDTRGKFVSKTVVGREWLDREMVPYFDGPEDEDDVVSIEPEEIGVLTGFKIEWVENWHDIKTSILENEAEVEDIIKGVVAVCTKCGHVSHNSLGWCPNIASDNECSCTGDADVRQS